jgi:hypothetical protein
VVYWSQVLPPTVAVKKSGRKVSANRSSSHAVRGNLGAVLPSAGGGVVDTSSATSGRSGRMAYFSGLEILHGRLTRRNETPKSAIHNRRQDDCARHTPRWDACDRANCRAAKRRCIGGARAACRLGPVSPVVMRETERGQSPNIGQSLDAMAHSTRLPCLVPTRTKRRCCCCGPGIAPVSCSRSCSHCSYELWSPDERMMESLRLPSGRLSRNVGEAGNWRPERVCCGRRLRRRAMSIHRSRLPPPDICSSTFPLT